MPHFAYAFRLAGSNHFYVGESRDLVLIKDKDQFKIWFYYLLAWTSLVERTGERTHSWFGPALIPHGVLFFFFLQAPTLQPLLRPTPYPQLTSLLKAEYGVC